MRLIDADALEKGFVEYKEELQKVLINLKYPREQQIFGSELSSVIHAICTVERAPTIDAVPVVRCKDCKYYVLHALACRHEKFNGIINTNGFCSYGEREE